MRPRIRGVTNLEQLPPRVATGRQPAWADMCVHAGTPQTEARGSAARRRKCADKLRAEELRHPQRPRRRYLDGA